MNKQLFFIFFLFSLSAKCQKQVEVISNNTHLVAYSDTINSKPIYTIQENEVFLINENIDDNFEWILVDISRNKFSKSSTGIEDFFINGFVRKSDIIRVDSLPEQADNIIKFDFRISKAETSRKNSKEILYGLEIPLDQSYEIDKMFITWNGERTQLEDKFFQDLYNITFKDGKYSSTDNTKFKIYKNGQTLYVKQKCGDGAGFYEITWVVLNGEIVQRLIDTI